MRCYKRQGSKGRTVGLPALAGCESALSDECVSTAALNRLNFKISYVVPRVSQICAYCTDGKNSRMSAMTGLAVVCAIRWFTASASPKDTIGSFTANIRSVAHQ